MTADKFRLLALSFASALESKHVGHPDFRINGRIFATLGSPDEEHGMIKLTPSQQKRFMNGAPGIFAPCAGKWGRGGASSVYLLAAKAGMVREGLRAA
jgi:hypothetical protein